MAERHALGEQHSQQQSTTAFEQHGLQIDVHAAENHRATVRQETYRITKSLAVLGCTFKAPGRIITCYTFTHPQTPPQNENLSPNARIERSQSDGLYVALGRKASSPGTPVISKQAQMLARRKSVADWVHAMIDVTLPIDTDVDFRAALRDGVVLCRLLNAVRPGTIAKV